MLAALQPSRGVNVMSDSHDTAYFREREAFERQLAAKSSDARIAKLHIEMAESYARLAASAPLVENDDASEGG